VLTNRQVRILLSSLHCTYEVAMEFDSRPGLKFLLQKVFVTTLSTPMECFNFLVHITVALGDRGFVLIDSGIPGDRDALYFFEEKK
jgi:hypothetical protein